LAATLKRRGVCAQMHQQIKEELGLDHFEGRSWRGLHHHALMSMLAFAFLQYLRLEAGEKKRCRTLANRAAATALPARSAPAHPRRADPHRAVLPALRPSHHASLPILNVAE